MKAQIPAMLKAGNGTIVNISSGLLLFLSSSSLPFRLLLRKFHSYRRNETVDKRTELSTQNKLAMRFQREKKKKKKRNEKERRKFMDDKETESAVKLN